MTDTLSNLTSNKLNKRILDMLEYESDNFLININLKKEVSDKLLSYQLLHVFNLITALRNSPVILDTSSTGTGKTYSAIALCKQLNLKPFIVCPLTVISKWRLVCDLFKVSYITVSNYETCISGQILDNNNKKVNSDVFTYDNTKSTYIWDICPKNSVIIFDEAHKCKNKKTSSSLLLQSAKTNYKNNNKTKNNIILLSATLSDNLHDFAVFGYMLNIYNKITQGPNFIKSIIKEDTCSLTKTKTKNNALNKLLYPKYGSQILISELGDKFPKNQICSDLYTLEDKDLIDQINSSFTIIQNTLKSNKSDLTLSEITKNHQLIERAKISIFETLIQEYLDNNFSIVVFVNFRNTLLTLANMFNDAVVLHGDLSKDERDTNIKDFQTNKSKIIICMMKVGGVGIDLHDLHNRPRVSLISPNYSCVDLKQALGRICRAGSKSAAIQRLIYTANTLEEAVCHRLNDKLDFLNKLNSDFETKILDQDLINI